MNLPSYEFLSAPLWLISTLHVITLTLHFIAMNFVVGGLIAILFGGFKDKWNNEVVQKFVKLFPNAMAATVSFGVAPLLFVQLVYHRQVYAASIVSGWFWLLIIPAVIFAYLFLYGASFKLNKTPQKTGSKLIWALLAVLYVSFVYSSVFSLTERPDLYMSLYASNQSGWVLNPDVTSYIFRWLHMILGAVTVGGFFVGLIGRNNDQAFAVGKQFFLWGMVAASAFGIVYLLTLVDIMKPFMRSPGIWILTLAILLAFGSLHFFFKKKMMISGLMVFLSLIGMVITRHIVRLLYLNGHLDPSTIPIKPQWGIFIVFLIFFVIALALIYWMLKIFFTSKEQTS